MKKERKVTQKEPSKASLTEMPEIDFAKSRFRRNPYAKRIASEGLQIKIGRGRPKKSDLSVATVPRSVRFTPSVWAQLEKRAKAKGITLHAALREAILTWARRAA